MKEKAPQRTTITLLYHILTIFFFLPLTPPFYIKVSPMVERFVFPKNLTRGKRLRVLCTVSEGDLPLEVDWWKDGILIGNNEEKYESYGTSVRRIDEYTSLLAISFLETTHAGNYSCVASNSVAAYSRSATLTIRGKLEM